MHPDVRRIYCNRYVTGRSLPDVPHHEVREGPVRLGLFDHRDEVRSGLFFGEIACLPKLAEHHVGTNDSSTESGRGCQCSDAVPSR